MVVSFYFYRDMSEMSGKKKKKIFKDMGGNLLELFIVTFSPSWNTFVPVSLVCTEVKVKLFGWYVLT